jgi:hypothetical protein
MWSMQHDTEYPQILGAMDHAERYFAILECCGRPSQCHTGVATARNALAGAPQGGAGVFDDFDRAEVARRALWQGEGVGGRLQALQRGRGYFVLQKRPENQGRSVQWEVALRPSQRRALPEDRWGRQAERIEQLKAQVGALVEHPFQIVKNIFGLKKVRYRGLAKNTAQLFTLFGLANLMIAKRWLLAP